EVDNMELLQRKCPTCHSAVLQYHTTYATQHHGRRILDKCARCPRDFSETKKPLMAGVKTPVSVLWHVVKARTEGMGLHAAARTFEKATHTILAGERKLGDLPQVLFLSAWVHEFFAWVREGDDASTKVQKHVPPAQSPGGTIRVRDRASRVIWDRDCGKKARKRLHQAITSLDKIARRSEEHTSELQSHRDLRAFPTRRSSDLEYEIAPVGSFGTEIVARKLENACTRRSRPWTRSP